MNRIHTINILLVLVLLQASQAASQNVPVFKIDKLPVNDNLFSEISPVITKDGIIFCSDRRFSAVTDRTTFDGRRIYNLYMSQKKDSLHWTKPLMLSTERSSHFNNGPLSIAPDGKTVYFTSEVETGKAAKRKNYKNHSGIFTGELTGTGLTSLQPFKYNSPLYEVANPSISHDGKFLFFASDMPGGYGKSDIYYCELINNEWSAPVNLGPKINTAGIENFPYMHSSGILYFTSNRPGGFGKLDVYSTSFYNGRWEDPVLLPEPINSSSDDFALVASEDLQTGYFASNRSNNDDIFTFTSTIIRKTSCNELVENSFCYRFMEENAAKYDSLAFRYEWKFGDGEKARGAVVEHCFPGPGKYIVQLDVLNTVTKEVIYNEKTDTLILENVVQPYITSPDTFGQGRLIKMDAGSTNLPGWNIGRYYWNFGDGTVAVGTAVDKIYTRPGTYNIQLIVTSVQESDGSSREACVSKNIIVKP